jgi:hypothetical protein
MQVPREKTGKFNTELTENTEAAKRGINAKRFSFFTPFRRSVLSVLI